MNIEKANLFVVQRQEGDDGCPAFGDRDGAVA
jgi:hypothetical protein